MWVYLKRSTSLYLLLCALGALVGWLFIGVCQRGCPLLGGGLSQFDMTWHDKMVQQPDYAVWLFFFIGTFVLGVMLAYPLWRSFGLFRPYLTRSRKLDLAAAMLIVTTVMVVPNSLTSSMQQVPDLPIYGFSIRTFLVLLINLACFLPAFAGTWLIRDALEEKYRTFEQSGTPECALDFLNTHIQLRALSQEYLLAIGLDIIMATFSTGANRNLRAVSGLPSVQFPQLVILVYGLYFTVLVALIYRPTYLTLVGTGHKAVEKIYPVNQPQTFAEALEKRQSLEHHLHINLDLSQGLRTGLVVLSPLLIGLLTNLLGKP